VQNSRSWLVASAILGLVAVAPIGAVAAAEEDPFLRGTGLAFPDPLPGYGESLEVVGRLDLESSRAPFGAPSGPAEHTWTLTGPVVHSVEEPTAGIRYLDLTPGVLEIRRDPAQNSQFSPGPPNALVPSSFHDGENLLLATVTGLRIRDIFGIVTVTGDIAFEGGTALAELGGDVEWSFDAAVSVYGADLPPGYGSHWNVELRPREPVSVETATWAGVKSLYR
jgi:hypothetical protein